MHSTPASLLERLRQPSDTAAWGRFVELYSPLLFHWAKQLGLQDSDAADLVQDVFLLLLRQLPTFNYNPSRSFHGWLKTTFRNQQRLRQRRRLPVPEDRAWEELPDDPANPLEEQEYRHYLIRQAFQLIERDFTPVQRQAFQEYVLRERPPEEVARELGLSPGTVYGVKSKVLARLRQELRWLLD